MLSKGVNRRMEVLTVKLRFLGPPLAVITARIRCGIVSISSCNVTTFRSCIDGRVGLLDSLVANPCVKIMFHAPSTTHSQLEPDESWYCLNTSVPPGEGKKKPKNIKVVS